MGGQTYASSGFTSLIRGCCFAMLFVLLFDPPACTCIKAGGFCGASGAGGSCRPGGGANCILVQTDNTNNASDQ